MQTIILYLATLTVFLGIDAVWIRAVMRPMFERHVGDLLAENTRLGVAAAFYALYVIGILHFASAPVMRSAGPWTGAAFNGALFGFFAYGCYEATNMATLRGWSWRIVATDVAWGTVLTAVSAVAGLWIARAVIGR